MDTLKISLANCYGIRNLDDEFDFKAIVDGNKRNKAFAIYAPNGTMKSSLSKTFHDLQNNRTPKEEVYKRKAVCNILTDGTPIDPSIIYVLRSETDITKDSNSATKFLVNPSDKLQYDELVIGLNRSKSKVISQLNRSSGIKKSDIEDIFTTDIAASTFEDALRIAKTYPKEPLLSGLNYQDILNEKTIKVFDSTVFIDRSRDFKERYEELFSNSGTIYKKGLFSPQKAETSYSTLRQQGYFESGHRVHLEGHEKSLSEDEFKGKIDHINRIIDSDTELASLRNAISQNSQTQEISNLLENLPNEQVEFLLENIKKDNRLDFKILLWSEYTSNISEVDEYLTLVDDTKSNIAAIEERASESTQAWQEAITLFNDRFIDMPFTLNLVNPIDAVLGRSPAKLEYLFDDGLSEAVKLDTPSLQTLSQGEKRALYLLNFIFDVEYRKRSSQETIFIIDDIADSFDYKNKHAIVQYLNDLTKIDFFHQIILTHNFDFYRAISTLFVHRKRALMINKSLNKINLVMADGVNNIFINKWKNNITTSNRILCASIPFARNLIEYTSSETDSDYITLTRLLHWKRDSLSITEGGFYKTWNKLFNTSHPETSMNIMHDTILNTAQEIVDESNFESICLEDKVVLSIAIRLLSEKYMVGLLKDGKADADYWPKEKTQHGKLISECGEYITSNTTKLTLERVGITVNSNIHLNSFMYEPILDLTIEHLIHLYEKVKSL